MLSIQKFASNWTGLGYGLSSSNTVSTSTTVFVPPVSNTDIENTDVKISLASKNLDKGKSILRALPKLDKKDAKNPKAKKANSQKPKQKKQHLCHHCEATGHTRPNCYKWLATQQSNDMIASGSQNQFQSSLAPLGDLLKVLLFLSNLNGFNSSPSPLVQAFNQRKCYSKVWKKKDSKWFYHFLLSSCFCLLHYLCILLLFWVSLVLCLALFNMFLFVYFQFSFILFFDIKIKKKLKNQKNTKIVCVMCTLVLMYLGWPLKQSFLNFVSLVA